MNADSRRGRGGAGKRSAPTPIVGRQRELSQLADRLDAAGRGDGGVVLIAGEPGIGKTRLLAEFAGLARQAGWLVLAGRAYDTEGMPPYLPFVEAIREHLEGYSDDELLPIVEDAPSIATLIPDLRRRFPALAAEQRTSPEPERYRLFEAVVGLFLDAASGSESRGLLLCLDDLHWTDGSSLLLFLHLARRLRGSRLLVAGAYRPEEVDPSSPLFSILADLARENLDDRLVLECLSVAEAAALVQVISGVLPAVAVVEAIQRETAGNPFFVQELVRQLTKEGRDLTDAATAGEPWQVPGGVRAVIGKRLTRFSEDAHRLLEAGAVLGDEFNFDLAASVCAIPSPQLLEALDEGVQAGLLQEEGHGFRFGHPLIRRTIYDGLSLPRRQGLHLRAAETIERTSASLPGQPLAELAYHYEIAGSVPAKTFEYSYRAARSATTAFAWYEAVSLFEKAMAVMESAQASAAERCDLLLDFGETLRFGGQPGRAANDLAQRALQLAESLADESRAIRACQIALDSLQYDGGMAGAATPIYRFWAETEDRYARLGTGARCHADVALARVAYSTGRTSETWPLFRRAMEAARQTGISSWLFFALSHFLNALGPPEFEAEKAGLATESRAWPQAGVPAGVLGIYHFHCGNAWLACGQRADAEAAWEAVRDLAEKTQDPRLLLVALVSDAVLALVAGDFEAAVASARALESVAADHRMLALGKNFSSGLLWTAAYRLGLWREFAARASHTDGIWARALDNPWNPWSRAMLTQHQEGPETNRLDGQPEAIRIDADTPLYGLTLLLERACVLGDRASASVISSRLAHSAHLLGVRQLVTSVARHLGAAAVLCGDPEGARAYYAQALEACGRIGFRPEIALTRLQLGELLLAHYPDERADALAHLDFAIGEFEAMHMKPSLDKAIRLRGRRIRGRAGAGPGGLTAREGEVLRLIAAGKSNREIADALVLSVRTAERHITNLYTKTGVHSKAQATAYALGHGLA